MTKKVNAVARLPRQQRLRKSTSFSIFEPNNGGIAILEFPYFHQIDRKMKQTDGSGLVRGGEESPKRSVTVRVPATSANIGPGYDCLGMAVSKLYVSFFFLFFHPTFDRFIFFGSPSLGCFTTVDLCPQQETLTWRRTNQVNSFAPLAHENVLSICMLGNWSCTQLLKKKQL